ncbi:MAG: T9SS C-terminal target domain-containing protein [Bacteroidetes bacterium]|nr:T9SS C-terminal target domain-containing protein [Bacteroidota bacterium]
MKNIFRLLLIFLCGLMFNGITYAEEVHMGKKNSDPVKEQAAGCEPGSNYKYLDINNVRTLLYSYGNGWFLENAEYEIPKGSRKTSMFSYSLWIGGIDINNNLKLAAYRYGQGSNSPTSHVKNDFWPGPLTVDGTAAVDQVTCAAYDQLYPMTRTEVEEFLAWWDNQAEFPNYIIPNSIKNWPAHGLLSKNQAYYLAPFNDVDGDGDYHPELGDYPYYDLANKLCPHNLKPGETVKRAKIKNGGDDDTLGILVDQVLKGDQTLWCVFNDKGNYHSETQGDPIGVEIREQAFAFSTNDEINNMTFYSFEIINRSTFTLTNTYFSQWVDPDLGYTNDDYVGCDVKRGLGYCYNGTPIDGTGQIQAYGAHPPAVGVDFFQGPYLDPDGYDNPSFSGKGKLGPSYHGSCDIVTQNGSVIDMTYGINNSLSGSFLVRSEAINGVNFGDGIIDNERYGMRRFVYHNNSNAGVPPYMTDPLYAPEYYNFLRGIWKDNTKMYYGGNANRTANAFGPDCDFMFPGDSDPCDWGTAGAPPNGPKYWTEETAGNPPQDRRFMQSAGPFTLKPGACNYITVGIPWARTVSGTPMDAVELLRVVDDKCQALFDNCFAVLSGPNAPDLTLQEMDKQLIIYISNRKTNDAGSNYQEKYVEFDPNIPNPDTLTPRNDSIYHFEGYQLFQLKDATVSSSDIDDASKARLVAQCDVQNKISTLINWSFDQTLNGNVGSIKVAGENKGIKHSFVLTIDAFATGDNKLINHKQYYYLAVAYAYNNYKQYMQDNPNNYDGQKLPYLRGRNNLKVYTAIPHIPLQDKMNSNYGDGPIITRIQGQGNGGIPLEFSDATIAEILAKPMADSVTNVYGTADYPISYNPVYKASAGPLNVTVVDPLNVINGSYTVKFAPMYTGPANSLFMNKKIKFGKFELIDNTTNRVYNSDTTTIFPYEQLFLDLGIALNIHQVPFAGDKADTSKTNVFSDNGLLYAPLAIYENENEQWLSGVPDSDIPTDDQNWIRSGTYAGDVSTYNDFDMKTGGGGNPWDPNKNFAKIQGGTWAPYGLSAASNQLNYNEGPAYPTRSKGIATLDYLASVDIVITTDRTKWSRCPVIEMCADALLAEGGANQFDFRKGKSVNIDGDTGVVSTDSTKKSNFISPTGMGWFPGYAINLETGERLNIMFSENSWLVKDGGRDMIWNPSPRIYDASFYPVFGGQQYVYIMGSRKFADAAKDTVKLNFPAYDGGAYIRNNMMSGYPALNHANTFGSALYVGIPLSVEGKAWLSNQVTIKIRVSKPYQRYYALDLPKESMDTLNGNWPMYTFNTSTIATTKNEHQKSVSDLDLVNVVPNPYYAYDDYERNQLDNRIKIVNLPSKCTVTIFNMSGTLIRQFIVDKTGIIEPRGSINGINTDSKTSLDWDLKNFAGIPISGGVYLIHIKAEGLGERTVKWFGILRPVDLNSF